MKLLTEELRRQIPSMKSQENNRNPMVVAKFFNPGGAGTWYVIEFDGEDTFFGYVCGLGDNELGYFSLRELQDFRGRFGLGIERDIHFTPKKLSEIKAKEDR